MGDRTFYSLAFFIMVFIISTVMLKFMDDKFTYPPNHRTDDNMRLPETFFQRGIELASRTTLYGVKFDDMSRDELMAAAANGWKEVNRLQACYAQTASARAEWFIQHYGEVPK